MDEQKTLILRYDSFLFSEELHDVVFEFEDDANNANGDVQAGVVDDARNLQTDRKTIPAHSQILAFSSEVFRVQLFGALQERTIKIRDSSVDTFRAFLRCIYTGELQVTTENMFELAYLANKYLLSKITQMIALFFKREFDKGDNFWKLFNPQRVALFDDEENSLLNMLLARFESDTSKYLGSDEFLSLSEEIIGQLVRCDPLAIREADLYLAVVLWAEFQCERDGLSLTESNMRSCVKSFVHDLRMPTLRHDQLVYNGGIHTNKLLLYEEKVNLSIYCNGLTSVNTPFVRIPRRKSRDVLVCTSEPALPGHLLKTTLTPVVPNVNFRFVGVTYVLDIQKTGEAPERITTEVYSSKTFSKKCEDYDDMQCSFVWTASPGMEVSKHEVVSMAKDIILFSADRFYCIVSRPSPGISIHSFVGDFKQKTALKHASSLAFIRDLKYLHTVKSVHFLLP